LTDAELLASFCAPARPENRRRPGRELLSDFGSLKALLDADRTVLSGEWLGQRQVRALAGGHGNGQTAFQGSAAARQCSHQSGHNRAYLSAQLRATATKCSPVCFWTTSTASLNWMNYSEAPSTAPAFIP